MSKPARILLLLAIMIAAVVFAPAYMSHLLGGVAAGLLAIGVAAFALLAAGGVVVISAAGILTLFLGLCVVLLVALAPVLVPVALLVGFIWLIVRLASRRPTPAPPAATGTV